MLEVRVVIEIGATDGSTHLRAHHVATVQPVVDGANDDAPGYADLAVARARRAAEDVVAEFEEQAPEFVKAWNNA